MTGGKSGNDSVYLKPFSGWKKTVTSYIVYKNEYDMRKRMGKFQGVASMRLEENLLVVSGQQREVRPYFFKHFSGSSVGSMIGPVRMPPYSRCWQLKWNDKRDVYSQHIFCLGGKAYNEDPEERQHPRTRDMIEPVFFHSHPVELYEDICSAFELKAIIDLTPGDGNLAMLAFRKNLIYTGLCMTDVHCTLLMKNLEDKIRSALLNEFDDLYDSRLHFILKSMVHDKAEGDWMPKAKAKAKAKVCAKRAMKEEEDDGAIRKKAKGQAKKNEDDAAMQIETGDGPGSLVFLTDGPGHESPAFLKDEPETDSDPLPLTSTCRSKPEMVQTFLDRWARTRIPCLLERRA